MTSPADLDRLRGRPPIVYVEWFDSAGTSGWRTLEEAMRELANPLLVCVTVGYLLGEDDRSVLVAQSLGHGDNAVDNTIQIPRLAVLRQEVLGVPSPRDSAPDVPPGPGPDRPTS